MYWGYSQQDMADALGMSQAMVSEIERGTKSVTLETLDRYSEALGVKKSQLMFFAEEIEGRGPVRKGRLIVADAALRVLRQLKPMEPSDAERL
jgi:transcriptional regulator with XRE-family HTH domain